MPRHHHHPHKWSPISYRSSVGQGKFAGQILAFYHCATQPTIAIFVLKRDVKLELTKWLLCSDTTDKRQQQKTSVYVLICFSYQLTSDIVHI